MASKINRSRNKGTINEELLQRIDKMNDTDKFDPYASIKRTTILQEELFNNDDYEYEEDDYVSIVENNVKESKVPVIITVITILSALVVGAYIFINILK